LGGKTRGGPPNEKPSDYLTNGITSGGYAQEREEKGCKKLKKAMLCVTGEGRHKTMKKGIKKEGVGTPGRGIWFKQRGGEDPGRWEK